MRFWNLLARMYRGEDGSDAIAALASSHAAITARIDQLDALHRDLVRQVGSQNAAANKQFSDIRAICHSITEEAKKQQPASARNMAEVRRFIGGSEE